MERASGRKQKNIIITIRKMDFDFEKALGTPGYWNNDDPVSTHFINALQDTFPEGERFFMDSARESAKILRRSNLLDDRDERDLEAFLKQEASHSWLHTKWTRALIDNAYPELADYGKELHRVHLWLHSHLSVKLRLSITSAAEHFTASIAYMLIHGKPGLITQSQRPFQDMLLYHAVEELEHKSVCFDLLKKLSGSYLLRIFGFVFAALDIGILIAMRYRYLMKKDGIWDRAHKKQTRIFLIGKDGLLRSAIPRFLSYMNFSFHPWRTDDRKKMTRLFGGNMKELGIALFEY